MIVRTLENVEDMDPATLAAGIVWDFETFPEYLESVRRRGTVLNFTAYIGHSALRLYVMGDAAYERAATADEIERMCELVREAIGEGAAGFSTQLLVRAPRRRRQAGAEPLRRPRRGARAVHGRGRRRQGRRAHHAGRAVHLRRRLRVAAARRAPVHLSRCSRRPGGKHLEPLALHEQGLVDGASVWPQVTPRPLTMQFTLADPYSLNTGKVFGELLQGGPRRAHRRVPRSRSGGRGPRRTSRSRR